jgi:RND family efflux transporter MFP subunit
MHPQYKSDRPGEAPCCGMRLEPVYADGGLPAPAAAASVSTLPAGTVHVNDARQQLIGIRVAAVVKEAAHGWLRTTGRVAPDENRLYRINASTEMWIRKINAPTTGAPVRKDEPLCAFYTTNFLTAAQSYLYILNAVDQLRAAKQDGSAQAASNNVQLRQAIELLQNLGVSDAQIIEMAQTRQASALVDVRSPTDGYILARNITLGQWAGPGTELYQIADLSRIWILADLHESEARATSPGMPVRVFAPNLKLTFNARVSDVPAVFDAVTRLMRLRLEAENPRRALWPGMFVDVEFPIELSATVSVPSDAILDTGLRKTVFVAHDGGYFEPRPVETGWRFGDRVQVTRGLQPGERIVVAGNFLLDSESRMRTAAAGIQAPAKDPVCGMEVDRIKAKAAGRTSPYQGATYYFCSDQCKRKFDSNPGAYTGRPASSSQEAQGPAIDPVCGMEVDRSDAKTAGRTSQYRGTTYYFCSDHCKKQFDKEPAKHLKKPAGSGQSSRSGGLQI